MRIQNSIEWEGTWEEIMTHADKLAGHRVRVLILSVEPDALESEYPHSTAGALLKHAGKWSGDDLEERLKDMYQARGKAQF